MERQFNACQTDRSMYLSIFNSFRVKRCVSQCVSPKIAILPHFCFPWGRSWGNHANCCMDGKRIRCSQIVSQHVPICLQQFPSYSNRKCKKIAVFTYRSPHFYFPGDAPATITQYVAWMERQFNACQTPRSMYQSIYNSFRVIRCFSQCVSPHFCFPWGRPWGNDAKRCMDGKKIRCLQIVSQHVPIYI